MPAPITREEITEYTPESLSNLAAAPLFLLRPATLRDERAFRRALQLEGLVRHEPAAVRVEIKRALTDKWSPDDSEKAWIILNEYWDSLDALGDMPLSTDAEKAEFETRLAEVNEIAPAAEHLMNTIADVWPSLRRIVADNSDFAEQAPSVAVGMFLVGWRNFDLPFSRQADQVPLDTIDALRRELFRVEESAVGDKVEGVSPGTAYNQLANHVLNAMTTSRSAEKNLPLPSPNGDTPNGSTATSKADGKSRGNSTRKTRTASSPTTLAN